MRNSIFCTEIEFHFHISFVAFFVSLLGLAVHSTCLFLNLIFIFHILFVLCFYEFDMWNFISLYILLAEYFHFSQEIQTREKKDFLFNKFA